MTLNNVTDKIRVVLSGAVTTNQLECVVLYNNSSTPALAKSRILTETNNTTPVDLLVGQQGTTSLSITSISIYNSDTANATVTVSYYNGTSDFILTKQLLAPGETLQYNQSQGFFLENKQTGLYGGNTDASTNVSIAAWIINTSTAIIAANSDRRGISITNGTNKTILIRLGGILTSANYSVSLAVGGVYEVPLQLSRLSVNGMYTAGGPAPSGNLVLTIANK